MTDEGWRKPPPRRVLSDDEIAYIPPAPDTERSAPRKIPEAFNKLVQTPSEQMREIRDTQRKMSQQLDGFGQAMNRRFDIFHEELSLLRQVVQVDHGPRLEHVEKTLGQKAAKGGAVAGIILLAAPMLADALPKYRWLFDAILGVLQ